MKFLLLILAHALTVVQLSFAFVQSDIKEPISFTAVALNSTSISVSFVPPQGNPQEILYFRITLRESNNKHKIFEPKTQRDGRPVIFHGLLPFTDYLADLQYGYRTGVETKKIFSSNIVKTHSPLPKAPTNLTLVVVETLRENQTYTLVAHWQRPSSGNSEHDKLTDALLPLLGYQVRYWIVEPPALQQISLREHNVTNTTMWRSWFGELFLGCTYQLDVAAYNGFVIGDTASAKVIIPEGVPTGSPTIINMTSDKFHVENSQTFYTSNTVTLKWIPPDRRTHNGLLRYYEILCSVKDNQEISGHGISHNVSVSSDDFQVSGLKENSSYQCQIRALNNQGPGPWSQPIQFKTQYESLAPPLNVRCLRMSETQLLVMWTLPENVERPKYSSFVVWYSTRDDPSFTATSWRRITVPGRKTLVYINDISTSDTYVVRVSSVRREEPGNWSDVAVEESLPPTNQWIYVRDPQCEPNEGHSLSLNISWSFPVERNAPEVLRVNFSGIRVYFDTEGMPNRELFHEEEVAIQFKTGLQRDPLTGRQWFVIHSTTFNNKTNDPSLLQWNTLYKISIQPVFNQQGKLWGPPVTFNCTTPSFKPVKLFSPRVISVDSSNGVFQMLLKRANEQRGPVAIYHLLVSQSIDFMSLNGSNSWKPESSELVSWIKHWDEALLNSNGSSLEGKHGPIQKDISSVGGVFVRGWEASILFPNNGQDNTAVSDVKMNFCREQNVTSGKRMRLKNYHPKESCPVLKGFSYRAVLLACLQVPAGLDELRSVNVQERYCTSSNVSSLFNTLHPPYVEDDSVMLYSAGIQESLFSPNSSNYGLTKILSQVAIPLVVSLVVITALLLILAGFMRSRRRQRRPDVLRQGQGQNLWLNFPNSVNSDPSKQCLLVKKGQNGNCNSTNCVNGNGLNYLMYSRLNSDPNKTTSPYHIKCATLNGGGSLGGQGSTTTLLVNCNSSPLVSSANIGALPGGGAFPPHMLDTGEESFHGSSSIGTGTDLSLRPASANSHPPIPVSRLIEHICELKAGDGGLFQQEYETIDPGQQFTWQHSITELNRAKNRYANVVAYDHSRVILHPLMQCETSGGVGSGAGVSGIVPDSDYINANYLSGYRKQNAYIATQGPLQETTDDFWRMVWEQRSSIIVMMTRLEERSRPKCHQYWPTRGNAIYGRLEVTLLDQTDLAYYSIRMFDVHLCGSTEHRQVNQLQFTAWPDHGVPQHSIPLLLFIRHVRLIAATSGGREEGPIIVHCSAGVGRTGTFVVIDSQLERMTQERYVDIYGHVTTLRGQRNYMVQTEEQYQFVYEALREALLCGFSSEISLRKLPSFVASLSNQVTLSDSSMNAIPDDHMNQDGTTTLLSAEFARLNKQCGRPSGQEVESGSLQINQLKNRLLSVLPVEQSRVQLRPIRGVDGSDYINASFIDGYRQCHAYIATQAPLHNTVADFWRMLWENESRTIVMLTQLFEAGKEKCIQYWPSPGNSALYGNLSVQAASEHHFPSYILREFRVLELGQDLVEVGRDPGFRLVRQYHFTQWPTDGVPQMPHLGSSDIHHTNGIAVCEALWELINHISTHEQITNNSLVSERDATNSKDSSPPVIVHCSAGTGRTGVFLALSLLRERMCFEQVVDLFMTVKLLRLQRPLLVHTEDQYRFCYQSLVHYLPHCPMNSAPPSTNHRSCVKPSH